MGKTYPRSHHRTRTALVKLIRWGVQRCVRCDHVLHEGDRVALEHSDDRTRYVGWSHLSACRACGVKCSSSHGDKLGIARQRGRQPAPAPQSGRAW